VEFLGQDDEGVQLGEGEFGTLHISRGITGHTDAYWTYYCCSPSVPP
jgi:hypothetical protein